MNQELYIDYFKAKAAKLGNVEKRFSEFYPDEIFLPDISQLHLDLSDMCMLLGFYEMSFGGNSKGGVLAGFYRSKILLIKATKPNDYASQKTAIFEAERLALQLYMSCVQDQCNDDIGFCFAQARMDERPWQISPIHLAHEGATGVEITFGLKKHGNYNFDKNENPFL